MPPTQIETISIDRNAAVKINNVEVTITTLETTLLSLKTSRPHLAVVIRAHRELSVQKLVDLMDSVKRAGITKIGVVSMDAGAVSAQIR